MKIDSHQHFWKFEPVRDSWIDESMAVIQRDFFPDDLKPVLEKHKIDGCIALQADQSETETDFLLGLAKEHDFIKGVVGWVDLRAGDIDSRLEHYSQFDKLKGFRHVLQGETDRALMLNPFFMRGVKALTQYNFTYDILIHPDQLVYARSLVKLLPGQKFVIDHIAKPHIKTHRLKEWSQEMKALVGLENLYCKVSGMVTEADWQKWKKEDFAPYLDVVLETFGTKRVMFGSDWPVCNVAGGYDKVMSLAEHLAVQLSAEEQADFWGENAVRFYGL